MSIFDNIGKRFSETAKTAAKKSGDIVETTKLNINIAAEEDKIKKLCTQIGEIIYQCYSKGEKVQEEVENLCKDINSIESTIEEMKKKILELKNVKECPECGTNLQVEMLYCYKCGTKQAIIPKEPEQEEKVKEKETDKNEENQDEQA